MRINGLIKFFNDVRSQLQTGLAPDEIEPFMQQVKETVGDVESICRQNGVGIDRLPAPSRRAYVFLRELDFDNLPLRQAGSPAAAKAGFRIKNVVKTGEYFADRMWRELDSMLAEPQARGRMVAEMERQVAAIEQICERHGQTPVALEPPSRRVYCWLKYLGNQITAHLEALERAREVARLLPSPFKMPALLHLVSLNHLWRRRDYQNETSLKVHIGFQNGDRQVWQSLLQCSMGQSTPASEQNYRDFAASEDFNESLFELESFAAPPTAPTRGRAHDLNEIFARVNATYFGGLMPKPTLAWNRMPTARKFGHYQPSRDTVMISVTLDDPGVPDYAVEFVMYHELLHKKYGSMNVNGRWLAHSPSFRAEERQFAEYHEAERLIHELALRQRGLGGLSFDGENE
ncbi:MAG TPA: hypothetical protein VJ810_39970 [Blastocatellia bacterium]|nr:hypothetical protein [Blastocatellia bacterium]